jgi:hypothetical protein
VGLGKDFRGAIGVAERVDDDYLGRSVESEFSNCGRCNLTSEANIADEALKGHRPDPAGLGDSAADIWEFHFGSECASREPRYEWVGTTKSSTGGVSRSPDCTRSTAKNRNRHGAPSKLSPELFSSKIRSPLILVTCDDSGATAKSPLKSDLFAFQPVGFEMACGSISNGVLLARIAG